MRILAVRLDSMGDVLLTGPAIRALSADGSAVTLLVGPRGRQAAGLLPGVAEIVEWHCPWIDLDAPRIRTDEIHDLIDCLRGRFDRAVIFTSFHQSPLPTALLLRLADLPWIGAISEDFPGRLLDLRHRIVEPLHETERALSLARAAGGRLSPGDDGGMRIARPAPTDPPTVPTAVLHPGTSAPARAWPVDRYVELAHHLAEREWEVIATGTAAEAALTAAVATAAGPSGTDLGGRTDLGRLADTLAGSDVVVCGNTGVGHLAAAVGTPVVSLFAPTVPARQWAPYGVRALLGDQHAACANTRALECRVPGHPCLSAVTAEDVLGAIADLGIVAAATSLTSVAREGRA
jgi:ADP-heptose:LPS heptosyltransferase